MDPSTEKYNTSRGGTNEKHGTAMMNEMSDQRPSDFKIENTQPLQDRSFYQARCQYS